MMRRYSLFILVLAAGAVATFYLVKKKAGRIEGEALVREVVGSEELILELGPQLKELSKGLMNLQFPMRMTGGKGFAEEVSLLDLGELPDLPPVGGGRHLVGEVEMAVSDQVVTVPGDGVALWRSLLSEVDYFEQSGFKIVNGEFTAGDHEHFECLVKFGGLAKMKNGLWTSLKGKQLVAWQKVDGGSWEISGWKMKGMKVQTGSRLLFSEVLDQALPDVQDRARARHSIHEEEVIKYYRSGKTRARSYDFSPISMSQKPALSVVDVDQDGFDDLYIMVRMGENLLLRNRGDGTFEEQALDRELAVKGNSTCGLFADFDNDGDPDLMLGRSVETSVYFENNGSWFQEVKQEVALPALTVSMSAADVNQDGLLDIYVSTYRLGALGSGNQGLGDVDPSAKWPERFLGEEDAAEFRKRYRDETNASKRVDFLDQVGPPNVLLINRGGGQFSPAPKDHVLHLWKNSLQAVWSDFDEDGDPDLYVANDFASDHLFRNDGGKGFTDVTSEAGVNAYGFAMGASFGDYDQDGRQDLYVTNMFSKAGRRILSKFDGIDPDYLNSVNGNVLYRFGENGAFSVVSSLEPPGLMVAEAGWSWGGQFSDFDNDGDLDIYAMSGYFTAPAELASEVDL
ncbi:VCBS repeat-containing protein [Verrucomicrobiaceae bacterium 227]